MAYDFNGTNQRLSTASTPVTTPPFTFVCWFNPDTTTGGVLVSISHTIGFSRYLLYYDTKLTAYQINSANAVIAATTTASVSTNTWQHAAAVFTSNSSRTIYLNGGNSVTNTDSNTPLNSSINSIQIGAQFLQSSPASFTDGRIAEVGIWNEALNADEVASLSKGFTCDKVRRSALVFYAPLVRNIQDLKAGLTITNNNTATVAAHPRVYA